MGDVNGLPADTAMGLEQLWVWHVIACRESVRFSFGMLTRAGASSAAAVYRHRPFFLETMARVWHWYAWLPCFSPLVIGFFRTRTLRRRCVGSGWCDPKEFPDCCL